MTHGHSRPLTGRSTMPQVRNGVEVTRKMLAERDEVKAYIGQDVILVAQGAMLSYRLGCPLSLRLPIWGILVI